MVEAFIEEWRPIPEAPGYEVSNHGRVRSIDRLIKGGRSPKPRKRKGQILVKSPDKNGYHQVCLGSNHRVPISRKVHRIVMQVFVGISDLEVNHKDGVKTNNHISNLEYVTRSENHVHARRVLGKLIGKNHWNYQGKNKSKLTW